ncbi:hypothetical protein WS72_21770 [Burkholderia savannae]|uniref:Uncharacterized protein n=1 Tax=Burkholderia savannae TaxID=1637837 RepID=A0ABR5T370_9BURK|nr:hypothetical protein [Burkholderia savannae]KWZ37593.1 hypothetical protein WS72_21770 [Burkholderia savannae]
MIETGAVKIGAALSIGPSGGSQRATLLTSPRTKRRCRQEIEAVRKTSAPMNRLPPIKHQAAD